MRIKIQKGWILALWVTLLIPTLVWAGTVQLPQTGQTTCWDTSGKKIFCSNTGQDGNQKAGVAWPNPRFTDNGDETITDRLTGLMWTKDANAPGPSACSPATTKTWQRALDYVACLNSGAGYLGYKDWRLPNIFELESLVNMEEINQAAWLNNQGFNNVQDSYYLSSSTRASGTGQTLCVDFSSGAIGYISKSYSEQARAVRGGQTGASGNSAISLPQTGQIACYDESGSLISCAGTGQDGESQKGVVCPEPRFIENGNQTVTDRLTGLVWTKDGNAPGPSACSPATTKTWQGALDYVVCLNTNNYLGYNDWRLPNRKELSSLVNYNQSNPASWLNEQGFTDVQQSNYWSSTTRHAATSNVAWLVNFLNGNHNIVLKSSNSRYVRAVRGSSASTLYAKFAGAGIWKYNNTGTDWTQVTASNPQLLVTVGSTLYGTFEGQGIWKFNGTEWTQTTTSIPQMIVGTSSTLYGSFPGLGIWQWNGTEWKQTTTSIPQTIIASTSDLYGTFAGLGIWKFDGTDWNQLTTSIPDMLVTSGTKLYGTFANMGIWLWNGTQWEQATTSNPQMIAASSAKLYGSFTGAGIWEWDGATTWKQISPDTPTKMVASGTELYAVFAGVGVKKWDGTAWSLISGSEPVKMVVGE